MRRRCLTVFGSQALLLFALLAAACKASAPAALGPSDTPAPTPVLGAVSWRPASRADLAPGTMEAVTGPDGRAPAGGTSVQVDLDGDGSIDMARLELDGHRRVRLRLLARGLDVVPLQWPALHSAPGGAVATWLLAKPPGQAVQRDSLAPAAASALTERGAVEVCEPPDGPASVTTAPAEQRCFCSTWWWIAEGEARSVTACD